MAWDPALHPHEGKEYGIIKCVYSMCKHVYCIIDNTYIPWPITRETML